MKRENKIKSTVNDLDNQEMRERKKEENRQRAMEERKCFACGEFGHIAHSCRKVGEEGLI